MNKDSQIFTEIHSTSQKEGSPTVTTAEKSLRKIEDLAPDQQRRYAEALRDSIEWDSDDQAHPPSPNELFTWHQVPLSALEAQLVVLNKTEAVGLLRDVGQPYSLPTLRRILAEKKYEKRFQNRPIGKVGTRLVFTYAEVLVLCDNPIKLRAPEGLKLLLR